MIYILTFFIITCALLILLNSHWVEQLGQNSRKASSPDRHKPTMFEVRRLIIQNDKESAIRLYCQIFSVGRKEAQIAVEELERSIQQKKSDF